MQSTLIGATSHWGNTMSTERIKEIVNLDFEEEMNWREEDNDEE